MTKCKTYWGSHGCHKKAGHWFGHKCDCCKLPLVLHVLLWRFGGCVGRWPYYGRGTKFYH